MLGLTALPLSLKSLPDAIPAPINEAAPPTFNLLSSQAKTVFHQSKTFIESCIVSGAVAYAEPANAFFAEFNPISLFDTFNLDADHFAISLRALLVRLAFTKLSFAVLILFESDPQLFIASLTLVTIGDVIESLIADCALADCAHFLPIFQNADDDL